MIKSINNEVGLGNFELYLVLQNGNTFYDFVGMTWVTPISDDCKIFGIEYATPSTEESRYEFTFTPPSGSWDIEVFNTAGDWLGSDVTKVEAVDVINPPTANEIANAVDLKFAPDFSTVASGASTAKTFFITPITNKTAINFWKSCFCTFTTGLLAGQTKLISSSTANSITVESAYTGIPQIGDNFILVNR